MNTDNELLPKLIGKIPGPKAQELLDQDARYISPSYTRGYPLVVERGLGSVVWDVDGNRFLDFNAGIAVTATGHCHPRVVKAIQDQAATLIHMSGTDFYYRVQSGLAKELADIVPIEGEKKVFLSNSGTEAIECAMKLARYHTGRSQFISFTGAFHGRTLGSLSLTNSKVVHKRRMGPLLPGCHTIPYAYCYRCPVNKSYPSCNIECLDPLEKIVFNKQVSPDEVAAIFVEPIQGEGGYVAAPPEFLQRLRDITKKHGILLVFDEIQSGMGRTGKFFASEHTGVVADVYCIAKGIASGMPLGATVASSSLMTWASGAHATTFGGNPVSCSAALETIAILKDGLLDQCRINGDRMMNAVKAKLAPSPLVGDVRGRGLMIGVEIVKPDGSRAPANDLRDRIVDVAFDHGLLVLGCGPNTLRLCPLVVEPVQIDWAIDTLAQVFAEVYATARPGQASSAAVA